MQDQILDMLLKRDEITWQTIIYDLVRSEQLDPWDIDISILSKKYLETVKRLQETNFFISGKVILASAILLKIKSDKLLDENIAHFDNLLFDNNMEEFEDFEQKNKRIKLMENPRLTIRTPQARKKKVTIADLVYALEKALEVDRRRTLKRIEFESVPADLKIPEKKIDISHLIKELYNKVVNFFSTKQEKLTFDKLVSSDKKEDKIYTFVPLLHLANTQKLELNQEVPFGEIEVVMIK